jgi:hypothetical protein
MFPFLILVLFVACAYVYGRATKELLALEQMRLDAIGEKDRYGIPASARRLAQRMGVTMPPVSDELEAYCGKNGLADRYRRAHHLLHGAIAIALATIMLVVWLGKPAA